MINRLIRAISIALHAEFGDSCQIYMEEVKQGLQEPCFFISCLNPAKRRFRGKRYIRTNLFCIQYFPPDGAGRNEACHMAAERLFWCLESLKTEKRLVRGTGMHYEVMDGILHFFVRYDVYVDREEEPLPRMEELSSELSAKGQVIK